MLWCCCRCLWSVCHCVETYMKICVRLPFVLRCSIFVSHDIYTVSVHQLFDQQVHTQPQKTLFSHFQVPMLPASLSRTLLPFHIWKPGACPWRKCTVHQAGFPRIFPCRASNCTQSTFAEIPTHGLTDVLSSFLSMLFVQTALKPLPRGLRLCACDVSAMCLMKT